MNANLRLLVVYGAIAWLSEVMSFDPSQIEAEIFRLLDQRDASSSICPSDVARSLGSESQWRGLMDPVRAVAAELADAGRVRVTQGAETVDVRTAKGPVRIRRV